MPIRHAPLSLLVLLACATSPDETPDPTDDPECEELTTTYADADGDGWGDPATAQEDGCGELPEDRVKLAGDCDDGDALTHPQAREQCDGADNDCDEAIDEQIDDFVIYPDDDGDGYGDRTRESSSCLVPDGWVQDGRDCDDTTDLAHPEADEICDGIDNDCDGYVDDLDGDTLPSSMNDFYVDADDDGYGHRTMTQKACSIGRGLVDNNLDCDDQDSQINPDATEICSGLDEDCDNLIDDADPSVDPASQTTFYDDLDDDGFGDALSSLLACDQPPLTSTNDLDCDDSDPLMTEPTYWLNDTDGDGYGAGAPVGLEACTSPQPGLVPDSYGLDCAPSDPNINPGAEDICEDGIDQDCSGSDKSCQLPTTCAEWLLEDPAATDGVYSIEPVLGTVYDVWCDMTTDGGGWTLVASTNGTTLDDAAGGYHGELDTLTPSFGHSTVWSGLRPVITGTSDIRFACKNALMAGMDVDISFYDIHWYREITTGTDAVSCFNEDNGLGYDTPAPERRNNLNGTLLAQGNNWNSGYLEGEDYCGDTGDFTIDFDDRGMDSNQTDGTDWGEDDSSKKCGTSSNGVAWFIFVRE